MITNSTIESSEVNNSLSFYFVMIILIITMPVKVYNFLRDFFEILQLFFNQIKPLDLNEDYD
jgi:hypothetical protein